MMPVVDLAALSSTTTTTEGSIRRRRRANPITPREIEVLQWVSRGKSDWQVAEILFISRKTVNFHVECAKKKLRVATRVQAVLEAVDRGLLRPAPRV